MWYASGMPNLTPPVTVSLQFNQEVTLHENPKDAQGNPTIPTSAYTWAIDNPAIGSITPEGLANQDALFVPASVGVANVTAIQTSGPNGTEQSNYVVTVTADPFDHSVPSADSPFAR